MHLYIAFTSLLILISVRIVGVSFSKKRLPQILELVRTPLVLKSSKAHRATKLFVLLWCGIFIYCWLNEIELARNEQQLIRGFFAITAVKFGAVLNALLAAKLIYISEMRVTRFWSRTVSTPKKSTYFRGFQVRLI